MVELHGARWLTFNGMMVGEDVSLCSVMYPVTVVLYRECETQRFASSTRPRCLIEVWIGMAAGVCMCMYVGAWRGSWPVWTGTYTQLQACYMSR